MSIVDILRGTSPNTDNPAPIPEPVDDIQATHAVIQTRINQPPRLHWYGRDWKADPTGNLLVPLVPSMDLAPLRFDPEIVPSPASPSRYVPAVASGSLADCAPTPDDWDAHTMLGYGREGCRKVVPLSQDFEGRTLRDVGDYLALLTCDYDHEGGMGPCSSFDPTTARTWPERYWRIVAYAVAGSSEGHYLHVDALCPPVDAEGHAVQGNLRVIRMFQGKTFAGASVAANIASRCAFVLGLV